MSVLRRIAQIVRHAPVLEKAEWFWSLTRKPYHSVINLGGRGVTVSVGKAITVRMPPEYAGGLWESYEPEAMKVLSDWIRTYPNALVLDVGSAIGIYSLVCLCSSENSEVLAFDSDISSLKATRRMCQYVDKARLRTIYGFVSSEHLESGQLEAAVDKTSGALLRSPATGDLGTTIYRCIDPGSETSIPTRSLDGLLFNIPNRPILLKCDVEGAEMLVLQGAKEMIKRLAPFMLLSVHPPALPTYGHNVADVRAFLDEAGYAVRLLSVDHEEHWWCTPYSCGQGN